MQSFLFFSPVWIDAVLKDGILKPQFELQVQCQTMIELSKLKNVSTISIKRNNIDFMKTQNSWGRFILAFGLDIRYNIFQPKINS